MRAPKTLLLLAALGLGSAGGAVPFPQRPNRQGLAAPGRRPFPPPGKTSAAGQNLIERLMSLSPDEQREFLGNNPHFQRLSPAQRENIRRRLEEFNRLPPAQREALRERYDFFRQLSPEQQDRARALYRQWIRYPLERRQELRRELRRLRESSAEERRVRFDGEEFRNRFNEQERDLLRELSELFPEDR
jgi:hypothetical protein